MKTCDDMKALGQLGEALAKAQGEFGAVTKNAKNPHLRNRYADLASVTAAVAPALAANGLGIVGGVETVDGDPHRATLAMRLIHASGGWVEVTMPVVWEHGKGVNVAQSFGGGLTYARRYAVMTLLGLAPEDEDDGCSAGPMDRGRQQPPRQSQPPASARRGPSPTQSKAQASVPSWVHRQAARLYPIAVEHGAALADTQEGKSRASGDAFAAVLHAMANDTDGGQPTAFGRALKALGMDPVSALTAWRAEHPDKGSLAGADEWHFGGSLRKFLAGEVIEFVGWVRAQAAAQEAA